MYGDKIPFAENMQCMCIYVCARSSQQEWPKGLYALNTVYEMLSSININ